YGLWHRAREPASRLRPILAGDRRESSSRRRARPSHHQGHRRGSRRSYFGREHAVSPHDVLVYGSPGHPGPGATLRAQRVVSSPRLPSRVGAPAMPSLTQRTAGSSYRGWRAANSRSSTGNPAHATSSAIAPLTTPQRPMPRGPDLAMSTDCVLYVEDN